MTTALQERGTPVSQTEGAGSGFDLFQHSCAEIARVGVSVYALAKTAAVPAREPPDAGFGFPVFRIDSSTPSANDWAAMSSSCPNKARHSSPRSALGWVSSRFRLSGVSLETPAGQHTLEHDPVHAVQSERDQTEGLTGLAVMTGNAPSWSERRIKPLRRRPMITPAKSTEPRRAYA
jgi:hypothetical protein